MTTSGPGGTLQFESALGGAARCCSPSCLSTSDPGDLLLAVTSVRLAMSCIVVLVNNIDPCTYLHCNSRYPCNLCNSDGDTVGRAASELEPGIVVSGGGHTVTGVVRGGVVVPHTRSGGFPSLLVIREGFSINSGRSQYILPGRSSGGTWVGTLERLGEGGHGALGLLLIFSVWSFVLWDFLDFDPPGL